MAQRTILFDLDGTLWNSRPWFAEILARLSGTSAEKLEDSLTLGANLPRLASECGVTNSRLVGEAGNGVASLRLRFLFCLYPAILRITIPQTRRRCAGLRTPRSRRSPCGRWLADGRGSPPRGSPRGTCRGPEAWAASRSSRRVRRRVAAGAWCEGAPRAIR